MKNSEIVKHEATDDCHWKTNSIPFAKGTQSDRNANASEKEPENSLKEAIKNNQSFDNRTELFSR